LGFLTSIRASLVLISVTAIALILWLSVSFWYTAYVQRLDAAQLLESTETEDLLFEVSRGLSKRRSLVHLILSDTDPVNPDKLQQFNAQRQTAAAQLDLVRLRIESAMKSPSLRDRLTFVSAELIDIHQLFVDSSNALLEYEVWVSAQSLMPLDARGDILRYQPFDRYSNLIDTTQSLRRGLHFVPRFNDPDLDHLQVLRNANWRFSKALAREVSLLSGAIITGGWLTESELAEIDSLHQETLAAWDTLEQYAITRGALPELTVIIAQLDQQFFTEFITNKNVLLNVKQRFDSQAIPIEKWLAIEAKTIALLDQLDKISSENIQQITKSVESRAVRNLVIDTAIVLFSLLIGVVVVSVLRKIRHMATHDALTELPNRVCFERGLQQALESPKTTAIALLFADLDGFKQVNDTMGHDVGDKLLKSVANRLNESLGDDGLVARYGGDEFSIIMTGFIDKKAVLALGDAIVKRLSSEFTIDGFSFRIGVSIGVSYYPDDASTSDELKSNADFAMYYAKGQGRNSVCEFDEKIASNHHSRQQIKSDLKQAIEEQQFELVYQPQVGVSNQTVAGLEALIRWQHPQKGFIAPDQFIPIAEESGQIIEIGDWVLDEACRQMAYWHKNGLPNMQIAVNVCSMQFVQPSFVDTVIETCRRHALNPACLELEITESVLVGNVQHVIDTCHRLHEQKIKVAIDDFGTGYSSLSYLQALPVDTLKIDRAFVKGLDDATSKSVAKTIVMLAQSCGLETVAEGVETEEQLDIIHELGCDHIQGYFYSKPVSSAEILKQVLSINECCAKRCRAA